MHLRYLPILTSLLLTFDVTLGSNLICIEDSTTALVQKHVPYNTILYIGGIQSVPEYQKYTVEIKSHLIHSLLQSGYVITTNDSIKNATQISVKIKNIKTIKAHHIQINLLLKIINSSCIEQEVTQVWRQITPNIQLKIIQDLTLLSAVEIETEKIHWTKQLENRLSPINERDLKFGIHLDVHKPNVQSWFVLRSRSSFGRDQFEVYKAYFKGFHKHFSIQCGIFPVQIGIRSLYLNLELDQPYWDKGILFDTHLTGFSLTYNMRNANIRFISGANRTPSGLIASQVEYMPTSDLVLTGSALYVFQDDIYMDNVESAGIEIKFKNDHLFLYGVFGLKHYLGEPLLLERKIVPVLGEFAYQLSSKWHIKGAYFRVENKIEKNRKLVEETIYQEINYITNQSITLGIQYERIDIGDFVENKVTSLLYYHPIVYIQTMFKLGYISSDPRLNKVYLGIQIRIRF